MWLDEISTDLNRIIACGQTLLFRANNVTPEMRFYTADQHRRYFIYFPILFITKTQCSTFKYYRSTWSNSDCFAPLSEDDIGLGIKHYGIYWAQNNVEWYYVHLSFKKGHLCVPKKGLLTKGDNVVSVWTPLKRVMLPFKGNACLVSTSISLIWDSPVSTSVLTLTIDHNNFHDYWADQL